MLRIRRLAGLLAVAALTCSATLAVSAEPFQLEGVYRFASDDKGSDGKPVCEERWTFTADGGQTVQSGQEVVQLRFHAEVGDGGAWLINEAIHTNGLPDCMGRVSPDGGGLHRTFFVPLNDGSLVFCRPAPAKGPGMIGGCYGSARPEP